MKRDTYHNYVTGLQMMERRETLNEVTESLWWDSGLGNIPNCGFVFNERIDVDAIQVVVFVDSAGWTGRKCDG